MVHKEHWLGRSPREQHEQGAENVGFRGFHVAPAVFLDVLYPSPP